MVGIQRIDSIPGVANPNRVGGEGKRSKVDEKSTQDAVTFSPEAQTFSEIAELLRETDESQEVRSERVAQAKEEIENGTYKLQEVLLQVAARLSRYTDLQLS